MYMVYYDYVFCTGVHIGFEFSTYSIKEGDHSIDVCALIKTGSIKDIAIQINTLAMSKTAKGMLYDKDCSPAQAIIMIDISPPSSVDEDFVVNNSTLVFTDVDVKQCISVIVIDDTIIEMSEQLTVELEHPGSAEHYELLQENAVIVIEDNDGMY